MLLFGGLKQHEYSIFTPAYILLHSANLSKGQSDNTNNATKIEYTAIVDWLRLVIWSNYSPPKLVWLTVLQGPHSH